MKIKRGQVYRVEFPFVRMFDNQFGDNYESWKPGYTTDPHEDGYGVILKATGMGVAIIKIVSVCNLPGRYHQRIFFTRKWEAPDGYSFGNGHLEVRTIGKFKELIGGILIDECDDNYRLEQKYLDD